MLLLGHSMSERHKLPCPIWHRVGSLEGVGVPERSRKCASWYRHTSSGLRSHSFEVSGAKYLHRLSEATGAQCSRGERGTVIPLLTSAPARTTHTSERGALGFGPVFPVQRGPYGPTVCLSHWGGPAQAHLTHWQPRGLRAGHTPPIAGVHVLLDGKATWPATRLSMLGAYHGALQRVVGGKGKGKVLGRSPNSSVSVIPTCPSQHPFQLAGSPTP